MRSDCGDCGFKLITHRRRRLSRLKPGTQPDLDRPSRPEVRAAERVAEVIGPLGTGEVQDCHADPYVTAAEATDLLRQRDVHGLARLDSAARKVHEIRTRPIFEFVAILVAALQGRSALISGVDRQAGAAGEE